MIPIFPLQMVVFPSDIIHLHIFESRYRQLVRDCMSEARSFAIPPYLNEEIKTVASKLQVKSIDQEYDDGRMDITASANSLVRLTDIENPYASKEYAAAHWTSFSYDLEADNTLATEIHKGVTQIFSSLHIDRKIKPADILTTFDVGHYIGFSLDQEYELLCIPKEYDRQIVVLQQIHRILPNVKLNSSIRKRALLNGEFRQIRSF